MNDVLVRRLLGTTAAVLIVALVSIGVRARYAPDPDSYTVDVVLGRAGSGLTPMSDVKARGVRIGSVESLAFEDGQATGVLRIDGDVRLPAAEDLTVTVTAKTLLGEKQVTVEFPDERFDAEPFLQAGDLLVADRQPAELQEVLDTLTPFVRAIDGEDLATIVDALAEQQGEADVIAENLELGVELLDFADRTADQTLDNLDDLATVAGALTPALDPAQDRIRASLPEATRLLRERPDAVATALVSTSDFSTRLAGYLEAEEQSIARLLEVSDPVGAVLERRAPQLSSMVEGIGDYSRLLGGAAGALDDGGVFGYFRLFVDPDKLDPVNLICGELAVNDVPFGCPDAGLGDGAGGSGAAGGDR